MPIEKREGVEASLVEEPVDGDAVKEHRHVIAKNLKRTTIAIISLFLIISCSFFVMFQFRMCIWLPLYTDPDIHNRVLNKT